MTTPLLCLAFFASWTLALVSLGVVPYRVGQVLFGGRASNSFSATDPDGPEWYQRLLRAHGNCVENLPIFGALVLVGHAAGHTDGGFATLAQVVCAGRVGQTLAHLSSGSALVVNVRFTFFVAQVVAMAAMAWQLLAGAA